jgi:RNA polymerase sigma-70 factor (ECF subfamily)
VEEEYETYLINEYNHIQNMVALKVANEDVADVAQDVCLQFTRTIELFEGKCSLDSWLIRIIQRTISNYYRKKNRKTEGSIAVRDEEDIPQGISLPVVMLQPEEILTIMPEQYREVFILYFWGNLSHGAIAKQLHIHPEAARSRYRRGLAFCRKNMSVITENLSIERDIEIEWQSDQAGVGSQI